MKYFRVRLFQALLKPISAYSRRRRGRIFEQLIEPKENMRILDVGGQPQIWDYISTPLNITCLNLPGRAVTGHQTHHEISYVEGDGCHMPEFEFGGFDLIYSNSVIEHVGTHEKRAMFAKEIRRLSNAYWIQTPYKYFPIEAHCGMPFWWLYPERLRSLLLNRWRKKLPAWTDMIEETVAINTNELKELFPNAKIIREWLIFPKSIIAYSKK